MISEKDRILALILIAAEGPAPGQQEEKGWTDKQVRYGNELLRVMHRQIVLGLHLELPESLVRMKLAGERIMGT